MSRLSRAQKDALKEIFTLCEIYGDKRKFTICELNKVFPSTLTALVEKGYLLEEEHKVNSHVKLYRWTGKE